MLKLNYLELKVLTVMDSDVASFTLKFKVHCTVPVHLLLCLVGTPGLTCVPVWAELGLAIGQLWSVSAQRQALRWTGGGGAYSELRGGIILLPSVGGIIKLGSAAVEPGSASFL